MTRRHTPERPPFGRRAAAVAAALVLSGATPPHPRLDRARLCLEAMDLGCARAEVERARDPSATVPVRIQHLALAAEVAFAEGDPERARREIDAALRLDPGFTPAAGAWPPGWLAVLDAARAALPDTEAPRVTTGDVPGEVRQDEPLTVILTTEDASGTQRVALFAEDDRGVTEIAMVTADGLRWTAHLPSATLRPPQVRVWAVAFDRAGNGPGRWHSAEAPAIVRVIPWATPQPAAPQFYETWWFWTAVGAVAIGAAVGTAVALTDDSAGAVPVAPGHLDIAPVFP